MPVQLLAQAFQTKQWNENTDDWDDVSGGGVNDMKMNMCLT